MRLCGVRRLGLTAVLAGLLASGQSLAGPEMMPAAQTAEPTPAHRMEPGDVLEINVIGTADLKQRVVVGLDGDLQLNLVGPLPAVGMTLQELRTRICTALSRKVLKQRTPDGQETMQTIEPDDVTVTIAEYRPIYISGDVSRPGEIPFRPGILVSQAITLAGGYDIMRFRLGNPFLDSADMKSDYDTLWMDLVREQARIARIEAELKGQPDLAGFEIRGTPLRPAAVQQIIRLETDQLKARNADYQKEREFFERAVAQSDNNLAVLTEQQKNEKEGADLDTSDYERIRDLFQRGAVPITRLTDARRSMLLSATRSLQTQNQIEQVKKDREDARRNLQRTSDKRQIDLTQDLQNSVSKIATTRNKLEAVGDKLVYTGLVKSQLVRGKGGEPDLKISRRTPAGRVRTRAQDDTELLPGDVLEVSLEAEVVPPAPPQATLSNEKAAPPASQPAGAAEQKDSARGPATVAVNEPGRPAVRPLPDRKPPAGERNPGAGANR
ncbi:polysaccharide biosynthesis/export family protein [Methylobacterium sp. J-070]|uniref:polysaccharide biosynthesis/export family protein n=1 Tax=Methylobacterium sp. J-070 TaxID=2836650 RepID=UPI001FBB749B|nr:polysaccharide biosynthesis/export family protein [Methylobacterium sp. J-070]MCJ2053874.1 polysaccharide biosynthesis/export family protein [Methylobacterium sp. J-070]